MRRHHKWRPPPGAGAGAGQRRRAGGALEWKGGGKIPRFPSINFLAKTGACRVLRATRRAGRRLRAAEGGEDPALTSPIPNRKRKKSGGWGVVPFSTPPPPRTAGWPLGLGGGVFRFRSAVRCPPPPPPPHARGPTRRGASPGGQSARGFGQGGGGRGGLASWRPGSIDSEPPTRRSICAPASLSSTDSVASRSMRNWRSRRARRFATERPSRTCRRLEKSWRRRDLIRRRRRRRLSISCCAATRRAAMRSSRRPRRSSSSTMRCRLPMRSLR